MKSFLIAILVFLTFNCFSQVWGEPLIVSDEIEMEASPDMSISSDGKIHAVWQKKYNTNHFKIFYTNSNDGGNTWIFPIDISENDTFWCMGSKIETDNSNNVLITYGYYASGSSSVYLKVKNTSGWTFFNVTSDMPFSSSPVTVMDNNNKLFIFFQKTGLYYKTFIDGVLSETECPYPEWAGLPSPNNLKIYDAVCDNENNIHCIGIYGVYGLIRVVYFKYDSSSGHWSDITEIGNDFYDSMSIDVDDLNNPHVIWGDESYSTYYSFSDGYSWSSPLQLSENFEIGRNIIAYNQNIYIFCAEKNESKYQLIQRRNLGTFWEKEVLDNTANNAATPSEALLNNELLYTIYSWSPVGDNADIKLLKSEPLSKKESFLERIFIYPNPSSDKLFVEGEKIDAIEIYDFTGNLKYTYKKLMHFNEISLNEYEPGTYFIKVISNDFFNVRKIIITE